MINQNTVVVAIDHGWANMKTEQDVFTSGVSEITTEPALYNDVLEYEGKYYKIGGKRLEVKEDKIHDDNYYLLSLAATAMTLEKMHKQNQYLAIKPQGMSRFCRCKSLGEHYTEERIRVKSGYYGNGIRIGWVVIMRSERQSIIT